MIGPSSSRLYSLALSLAPAGWDEHQDKQGLASIGLLWCISRPRPRPNEQCDGDVSHRSPLTGRPMDQEPKEQSVFPLPLLYVDVYMMSLCERICICVSHHL